jgi:hypothetical protein
MRRHRNTVCVGTDVSDPGAVSLFTSKSVPRSVFGDTDIDINVLSDHRLSVSVSDTRTDLLNGMMNSETWSPDSQTPTLPFFDDTHPTVPLPSGTTVLVTQANTVLSLTVSGTTPVGFQWFVINTHSESDLTLVVHTGATMYGFGVITSRHGALIRLCSVDQFLVLETPSRMASTVSQLVTTLTASTPVIEPVASTIIELHTHASGATIVKTNPTSTIQLASDGATVGSFWYVVNNCPSTATIEARDGDTIVVHGGTTVQSMRSVLIRHCELGTFVVVGTPVDTSIEQLMSEVFGSSVPTNAGVLHLPSDDAPAGSTTIMNGPCGEVWLHSLASGIGQSWFVTNATPREVPVFGVVDGSVAAPTLYGAAFIPVGRLATIRQYTSSAFTVMLSHPEDTTPQSVSYFRTEVYTPGSIATVDIPRHPNNAGPLLKTGAWIVVTASDTVVNLWRETSMNVGGFVFHIQNNSSTNIAFVSGTGGAGATVNGLTTYSLPVGGRVTIGILDDTRHMRADTNPLQLPYKPNTPTESYRAGSGILLMNNNQVVNLNATTAAGFTVPPNSSVERAFCLRNVTNTTATLVAGTGVTITGSLNIAANRTAYVRNTGDGTWLVTVPIMHLPAPSLTDDPIPYGANVDISEPGSQIRIYADARTVGYWWLVNNTSNTDVTIAPRVSGTGIVAPTLAGANTIVPSGTTAVLRQIDTGHYTLYVPVIYRPVVLVSNNYQTLDGVYEDKLVVLKITTPDANGVYGVVLATTNNLSDGAVIEIINHCVSTVQVTSSDVILSQSNKVIISNNSGVIVRYVAGTGFLMMGDLV